MNHLKGTASIKLLSAAETVHRLQKVLKARQIAQLKSECCVQHKSGVQTYGDGPGEGRYTFCRSREFDVLCGKKGS